MATTRTIWLPKPLPHQLPVLLSPARFKVAACGRRWGKTAVGLLAVLRGHGPHRGCLRGAIDGGTVWWVAPTYGVAEKIWRDLKQACRGGWVGKSERPRRIALPGGGSIEVRSAENPDSLRGEGLDGLVIDEAAFLDNHVWDHVLRPSLSDKTGWAMFLSTPNGRNWFYKLLQRAAAESRKRNAEATPGSQDAGGWHGLVDEPTTPSAAAANAADLLRLSAFGSPLWDAWRLPTGQNPLITAAELDEAKSQLTAEAFAQEYEAQFIDTEHAEFAGAYFTDKIWFDRWPAEKDIRLRVMALDPSKGKADKSDYSAFVMIMLDADGTMWVEAVLERLDVQRIIDRGLDLARTFRPHVFGVEANQFQEVLCHIFQARVREQNLYVPLEAMHNAVHKPTRIRAQLTPHLVRGEFRFLRGSPGTELLVEQLRLFPNAEFDDGPDALEMAVRLIKARLAGCGEEEDLVERVIA